VVDKLRTKVERRRSSDTPMGYQQGVGVFVRQPGMQPQINAAYLSRAIDYMVEGASQMYQQTVGMPMTHLQKADLRRHAWQQAMSANRYASLGIGGMSMGGHSFYPAPQLPATIPARELVPGETETVYEETGYYPALTNDLSPESRAQLVDTYGMDQNTVRIYLLNTMLDVSRQMSLHLFNIIKSLKQTV